MMIDTDMFRFAYVPNWYEHLDHLAQLALPEPWRFKRVDELKKNIRTPILEKHIHAIYRTQVIEYGCMTDQAEKDDIFLIRSEHTVFNTGLLSRYMKPIYGYFERNKREGTMYDWVFKGFMDDSTAPLKFIHPLPRKPHAGLQPTAVLYLANLPIRVNVEHITSDPDNMMRLPEWCRSFKNLSLLLETAVETTRRMAEIRPGIVVAQVYQGRIQYLMPICLSDPARPDLAMTINPMDGYYLCSTCLTLEMAYSNARQLATPTVGWLTQLVE